MNQLRSQCTPAGYDACDGAAVLCSLDELNGYTCSSDNFSNPTACLPCNGVGAPHNSSWWAFVTEGGKVSITFTFGNCFNPGGGPPSGLQIGLVSACDCIEQIACKPDCTSNSGTFKIDALLQPCKIYYFWIDGCNGDVCNFSIATSGGNPPKLSPLGNISRTIQNPICKGCCSDFWVAPQPGGCIPEYVWTVDASQVEGNKDKANICFPVEGTFAVCVQAIIGNPSSGSICDTWTKCVNVTVAKKTEQKAKPRILCKEQLPIQWHCQSITNSGTYRCPFKQNGCCEFDSVIDITILNDIDGPEVFFIGSDVEKYIDPITKISYASCSKEKVISLPSSNANKCDSNYKLSAIFPKFITRISKLCEDGKSYVLADIKQINDLCMNKVEFEYNYNWYISSDTNSILSTKEKLEVLNSGTYCLKLIVKTIFGNSIKNIVTNYCSTVQLDSISSFTIKGNTRPKFGEIVIYSIDSLKSNFNKIEYEWTLEGASGKILTQNFKDSSSIRVLWKGAFSNKGNVCLRIKADGCESDQKCLEIDYESMNDPLIPFKLNCNESELLCTLSEYNGFFSQNLIISNPTACLPCGSQAAPHNSVWYAFLSVGGIDTIDIIVGDCFFSENGLQGGIEGKCDCSENIVCKSNCHNSGDTIRMVHNFKPCKIYYLWIDGCNGDVCNFTIKTSGTNKQSFLSPLGNISRSIPGTLCKGCCSDFWVAPQPGSCIPEYVWTVDGSQVEGNKDKTNICFPDEGTFSVCVEAVIGNPNSGSICDFTQPKCINVNVQKSQHVNAIPINLCKNQIPFKFGWELIFSSGEYRTEFAQGCCLYDSVITVNIINDSISIDAKKLHCAKDSSSRSASYKAIVTGGSSPYTYQWCNNESTATATQLPSGPCSVTVTDNNGCSKTISFEVCVSVASDEIPDLITPNGDGRNDQFILPASISSLGAIQLTIANRWGDVVFRSDDYKNDWDGREQKSGEDLPPTSYYYVLSQSGKIIQKGIISILR